MSGKWLNRPVPVALVVGAGLGVLMQSVWFGVSVAVLLTTAGLSIIGLEHWLRRGRPRP